MNGVQWDISVIFIKSTVSEFIAFLQFFYSGSHKKKIYLIGNTIVYLHQDMINFDEMDFSGWSSKE